MMSDWSKYRPGVGIMLINQNKQVFVGQRKDSNLSAWQMPQGGIDEGESPEAAMWRELGEEVGSTQAKILAHTPDWLIYNLPSSLVGSFWGGKYIGQRQIWYLLQFLGQDCDINLETEHPEFKAWKWVLPQLLPELAVAFKRDLYEKVLLAFNSYL